MKKWVSIVFSVYLLMASSLVFAVAKQDVSARDGAKTGAKAASSTSAGVKTGAKAAEKAVAAEEVSKDAAKLPVGRRGKEINVLPKTNSPTVINGRKFTGHSLDRMQGRGFTPSVVEDVIKHPTKILPGNKPGTRVYFGEKLKVILNEAGDVMTVIFQ